MTVWETVERGEYVMIALAVIIILIVVIWWCRGSVLSKWNKSYSPLMHRVHDHIMEGDIENVARICAEASTPGGTVLEAGARKIGEPMAELKSAMKETAEIEKGRLGKGERWLRAFAVISPLLGFGGTLVGIIDRLRDLGESQLPVDASIICAQLAPTIVTTVAGLITGIFAIIAFSSLDSIVETSRRKIDRTAADFIELLNQPA